MNEDFINKLRKKARKKLYEEWGQIGDFQIGIEATLESLDEMIEIPEGWEEFHREMDGETVVGCGGYMDIEFQHPILECAELGMGFLPEFLPFGTKVGMILIRPLKKDSILKDREYWHKGLSIIACVEPLVKDAQLCLAVGDSYRNHGCLQEALDYYNRAEKRFLRAEQRWKEILEQPFPTEFTGLKNLILTGYME